MKKTKENKQVKRKPKQNLQEVKKEAKEETKEQKNKKTQEETNGTRPVVAKLESVLEIFGKSATFLWWMMTFVLVATSALFICHVTVTKWHLPLLYLGSAILYLLGKKKEWKKAILAIFVATLVFTTCSYVSGKFYDSSADGNTYHKLAVGAMKNGWNPVYQDVVDFGVEEGNPFEISKDNVNINWVDHYAKGTEIFASVVYAFSSNIETGKVYNLLFPYIGLFVLYEILRKMKFGIGVSLATSFVMAFNPISLVQMTNYYLDGVLAISLFVLIFCCIRKIKEEKLGKEEKRENNWILAMAIIWACNAKFTGVAYAAIFAFVFYLYKHIRTYCKNREMFRKSLVQDSLFYLVVVFVSLVVVGSTSYLRNWIDHGHPLYPLYGKNRVENMVMKEIPLSMQDKNSLTIFFTSLFAYGENVSASYAPVQNDPDLKIPFTVTKEEISHYNIPDIRMAGFGPLFSGVFLLAVIGLVGAVIFSIRKKDYEDLCIIGVFLVTTMSLILLLDGGYWARYIPYFYLFPILICLYGLKRHDILGHSILPIIILVVLFLNSTLIATVQISTIRNDRKYIRYVLETFEQTAKEKEKILIHLPHKGLQGIQYNIDDLNIHNYELSEEETLSKEGYFFTYEG